MELPLTELKDGETGIIKYTDFTQGKGRRCRHGQEHAEKGFVGARFSKRLSDLGLTPGTKVTVVKSAPFKGPLEVCVRGSRLAIGRGMACKILVDVQR